MFSEIPPLPIGRLLLQAAQAYRQTAAARPHQRGHAGLSLSHASLLTHIEPEGTRLTAIAERAEMTKQSASQMIAELEGLGYIERRREENDGRAQNIRLTGRGKSCVKHLQWIQADIEETLVTAVGAVQTSSFCVTLARLPDVVQAQTNQFETPAAAATPVAKQP